MAISPKEERTAAGVGLMVLAVAFFTLIDSSAKWLFMAGLPALQVVFCRYFGHFIVALILFMPSEGPAAFQSNRPWLQFFRSLALLGGTTFNFFALMYLPITVTTTIMFAGPIAITLLSIPMLGEQVGIRRILAVCMGFVGVLVVMQPWGAEFHPAMLLCLVSLVSGAIYFVLTRMLAGVDSNATAQLWTSGVAAMGLLPFALQDWVWPTNGLDTSVLLGIGLVGALGHIAATRAHRLADASILAPVVYVQILFAALAGIAFFDTWPTIWTLFGGLIIAGSGLYIWQRERAKGKPPSPPDPRRAE